MEELLKKCRMCPRECGVNRYEQAGICGSNANVKVALSSLHFFEEPCISGTNGSGTIFFSNCNLKCIYCQNYKISHEGYGKEITIDQLSEIFLKQQKKGAHNINLVTPSTYVYQIIEAIKTAKEKGLAIPIIYNSSGYESIDTLKLLNGYIDVYLPDFKYFDNEIGLKFSKVNDYFNVAANAIMEMHNQVGNPIFNNDDIIQKGVIIRHMILPGNIKNSKNILEWISNNLQDDVYVSIMAQYFPAYKAKNDTIINRKITHKELDIVRKYINKFNLTNGYIQKLGKHEEEYVPNFDLSD